MEIRLLQQKDFDTVLSMMEVFYASDALIIHPERETLRKTLTDAMEAGPYLKGYGFFEGEMLCGYGMVAMSYSTEAGGLCAWIEDIYVEPNFRGKGYGTAFLRFVAETYGPKVARLRLEAEPENEKAISVYKSAGYEVLGYTQLIRDL